MKRENSYKFQLKVIFQLHRNIPPLPCHAIRRRRATRVRVHTLQTHESSNLIDPTLDASYSTQHIAHIKKAAGRGRKRAVSSPRFEGQKARAYGILQTSTPFMTHRTGTRFFFLMCVWFTLPECFTFLRTSFVFSHGSRFSNCFFLACPCRRLLFTIFILILWSPFPSLSLGLYTTFVLNSVFN